MLPITVLNCDVLTILNLILLWMSILLIYTNDLYALHIQYIAVRKDFQRHHIGDAILKHILRNIGNIVFYCPLRLVTLEAFQELVDWYKGVYI